ncbi:MAG: sensor histidine kinase [Elainellaceae cyanobacterium]
MIHLKTSQSFEELEPVTGWISVYKQYLPTLSEIIALGEPVQHGGRSTDVSDRGEREWYGAIAALNLLLQQSIEPDSKTIPNGATLPTEGVVLSGPLPVLMYPDVVTRFSTWTLTVGDFPSDAWSPLQLLPAPDATVTSSASSTLPLLPQDPLAQEQFCLVLTPEFSVVMTLQDSVNHPPAFQFSFTPDIVWQAWRSLRSRLQLTAPHIVGRLTQLVEQFAPVVPNYRTVADFTRLMLDHLPEPSEWKTEAKVRHAERWRLNTLQNVRQTSLKNRNRGERFKLRSLLNYDSHRTQPESAHSDNGSIAADTSLEEFTKPRSNSDAELLQAIAHEVRTPLTTIRTLTRLLLRRKDLKPDAVRRLEMIDRECTKQIDRFTLIFRAVELETKSTQQLSPLAKISLAQVFQQTIPRWQQQAEQHNLTLDVVLPQTLPMVMSDPIILDQILTGLIDRITSTLPSGSQIQVHVVPAGNQLKLQFHSRLHPSPSDTAVTQVANDSHPNESQSAFPSTLKSVGHLLMFQPETGNLSLNLAVTKNLFHALGGKLTVRQHPQQGEVLTIFLPLENSGIIA